MKRLFGLAVAATILAQPAHALVVVPTTSGTLDANDPTTSDRLFRDGTASTWASPKAFPGTTGSGPFVYDLIALGFAPNATQDVYYRITLTNTSDSIGQPHGTAYLGAFDPTNFATDYLGDSGGSPNPGFATSFEVVVGAGNSLVLHFGATGSPLPSTYSYSVEAFSDADGGENFAAVPEPASWALMISGFGLLGAAARRRSKTRVSFA